MGKSKATNKFLNQRIHLFICICNISPGLSLSMMGGFFYLVLGFNITFRKKITPVKLLLVSPCASPFGKYAKSCTSQVAAEIPMQPTGPRIFPQKQNSQNKTQQAGEIKHSMSAKRP